MTHATDKNTLRALTIGLEYAEEHLSRHDTEKGRKFPHLALEAQQIEEDISDIKAAIRKVGQCTP